MGNRYATTSQGCFNGSGDCAGDSGKEFRDTAVYLFPVLENITNTMSGNNDNALLETFFDGVIAITLGIDKTFYL